MFSLISSSLGFIENNNSPDYSENNRSDDVKSGVGHNNLTMINSPNIKSDDDDAGDDVNDDEAIHDIFSTNFNPVTKEVKVAAIPITNVAISTLPENPGTKNPTTVEPNNILARSIRKPENLSSWILFKRYGISFNYNNQLFLVKPPRPSATPPRQYGGQA